MGKRSAASMADGAPDDSNPPRKETKRRKSKSMKLKEATTALFSNDGPEAPVSLSSASSSSSVAANDLVSAVGLGTSSLSSLSSSSLSSLSSLSSSSTSTAAAAAAIAALHMAANQPQPLLSGASSLNESRYECRSLIQRLVGRWCAEYHVEWVFDF